MSVKIADFIEAPNSGGDYRKVLLVVHVTVSPEVDGAARNVIAGWNRSRTGSTQFVVDNREIIQAVRETAYAWSAGTTANKWGIHVEHCGFIQTVRQWRDGYSTAELELSAPLFAELGEKHGIPLRRITPEQARRAVATGNPADGGVLGHNDIRLAFPGETTHTDPGTFFPWDRFMGLIQQAADTQEDFMATSKAERLLNQILRQSKRNGRLTYNRDQQILAAVDKVAEAVEAIASTDATRGQVAHVRGDIARLAEQLEADQPDAGDEG